MDKLRLEDFGKMTTKRAWKKTVFAAGISAVMGCMLAACGSSVQDGAQQAAEALLALVQA